jgi:hypothetical protein
MASGSSAVRSDVSELAESAEDLRSTLVDIMQSSQNNQAQEASLDLNATEFSDVLRNVAVDESIKADLQRTLTALGQSKKILKKLGITDYNDTLDGLVDEMSGRLSLYVSDRKSVRQIQRVLDKQRSVSKFQQALKKLPKIPSRRNRGVHFPEFEELDEDSHELEQIPPPGYNPEEINYTFNIDDSVLFLVEEILTIINRFMGEENP